MYTNVEPGIKYVINAFGQQATYTSTEDVDIEIGVELNEKTLLERVREGFRDVALGGSRAFELSTGKDLESKDVDIYVKNINVQSTWVLKKIITDIVMEGIPVSVVETEQGNGRYSQPCIRRRIQVRLPGDLKTLDFIFVETDSIEQWILKSQATSLTEVCFTLGSNGEIRESSTRSYKDTIETGDVKVNRYNNATAEHKSKILARARMLHMRLLN